MAAGWVLLPHRENCRIDSRKLTHYLLDESRRSDPDSKVGLFRDVLGFTEPAELRWALLLHARGNPAQIFEQRSDRVIYNVVGPLRGPHGSADGFVSAWQIIGGTRTPHFVTALLAPRRRRS